MPDASRVSGDYENLKDCCSKHLKKRNVLVKISKVCLVILLAVGSIGIVKYLHESVISLQDYKMVQNLEALARSTTTWSDATVALSLERSVTQVALSVAGPAPAAFKNIIRDQRSLSDSTFQEALAELDGIDFETKDQFIERAEDYHQTIKKLRSEVDAMLAVEITDRPRDRAQDLPYELKANISGLKSLSNLLVIENSLTSSTVAGLTMIESAAWEIREFGGRARTYYAIATLHGTPVPPDLKKLIEADSARAAQAWETLQTQVEVVDLDQDFSQRIDTAGERYFGTYLPVLERLDTAMGGASKGAQVVYPVTFDEFFKLSNKALDDMAKISQDAGMQVRLYWEGDRQSHLYTLLFNAGLMILDILLVCAAVYFVATRLANRIAYASQAIEAVTKGDLNQEIDERENDLLEIRNLTSSLKKLIASAREARKLSATLDDVEAQAKERIQIEKEREERRASEAEAAHDREMIAAQEKKRLAAFTGFQADMENVLGQAASGDFSNRISDDLQDQSLVSLAMVINRLLDMIETNIADVVVSIDALSQGNLGVRIEGERQGSFLQLQEDFNAALSTLSQSMSRIMQNGQNVAATSSELEATSRSMAKRAEDSAAAIQQTSAAAEDIATSIRQVVENAKTADVATRKVRDSADQTKKVSDETEASMHAMTEASTQINRVVKVIEDIAFQINLLALNAGVEAARAGEAGRGFSVVASEVRALAQRSQDAVREISEVIEQNNRSVEAGVEQVELSRNALQGIISDVEVASSQISDIAKAVEQQSHGIEEVTRAVRSIDSVSQTNAAALEGMTASSVAMNDEAKSLSSALGQFHGVEVLPVIKKAGKVIPMAKSNQGPSPQGQPKSSPVARKNTARNDDWAEF